MLANEFLQPLDGLHLGLLALLPEPLEFGEFVGVLDVLVVPPHGVETLAQVVDHVVVVVPDRFGLANEIVLLNVLFAHGESPFRVKTAGKNPHSTGVLGDILEPGAGASTRSSGTAARSSNSDAGSKNLQATAAANWAAFRDHRHLRSPNVLCQDDGQR